MTEELVLDDAGAAIIEQPIARFAERAYLEYAMSVVKSRALPSLSDGQKPVQRRILFAMNEMRLSATSKHVKSARVVGDVIGKYHPHGDSSVYDAMVRIAQDFSMRYPIVDGQGNFGSRDGDGAAAMRYTECRLTPIAELLLSELDSGTVDFGPNYDGAFEEPLALPARLPMLLLNGASGIAVGMATEIPSHNLREVADAAARIVRQETFNLSEVIPGPDYPGGGQIISSAAEIAALYENGRGSLRGRARWTFEDLARGQWRVIVHELPHGVGCAKVLEELENLTNPQVKAGKKALSQDQLLLKQTILSVLDTARDESNKDQAVRLVFEPKSSRVGREELMQVLLAHTSLEVSLPINLVTIGLDGAPRQKSLRQMLDEWVMFRLTTVERRLRHRLEAVLRRLHVLEGRKIVYLNLDEVIRTIREADEPKTALMEKFGLSETQADDILEIRLRQLARLEWLKIEQEVERLTEEKHSIESLLADETKLRGLVADEIEADAKRYGDDRRTLIEAAQSTTRSEVPTVVDEPMTLIVSRKGWVRARTGHHVDPQTLAFKDGDSLMVSKPCRTTDTVIFLTTTGRTFSLPCTALPNGRGDGAPLSSLLETAGTKIAAVFVGPTSKKILLAASNGYGFLTTIGDMVTRQKSGKAFMTIADKETILHAAPAERDDYLLLVSAERFLAIRMNELRLSSTGGKGLQLIALADSDVLKALHLSSGGFEISLAGKRGKDGLKKFAGEDLEAALGRRGAKGRPHEGVKLVVAIEADPNAALPAVSAPEPSSDANSEACDEEGGEPA